MNKQKSKEKSLKTKISDTEVTDTVRAVAKYVKISAFKLRKTAKLIDRIHLDSALIKLKLTSNKSSKYLYSVIQSAASNATNNHNLDRSRLYISNIQINEGPKTKRFQARARGRLFGIIKPSSHIVVEVSEYKGDK